MPRTAQEIQGWCIRYISNLLKVPPEKIDAGVDFDRHGLDSALAVAMILDLEEFVGAGLSPSLLFEHPNISALSNHLGQARVEAR